MIKKILGVLLFCLTITTANAQKSFDLVFDSCRATITQTTSDELWTFSDLSTFSYNESRLPTYLFGSGGANRAVFFSQINTVTIDGSGYTITTSKQLAEDISLWSYECSPKGGGTSGGGGGGDATAANQTTQIAKATEQNDALTSIGTDQLRVDIISGGGTSDATAANQTTQIAKATEQNDALTSIGTDQLRVDIISGGGTSDATAANQTTQITEVQKTNTALSSGAASSQMRVDIISGGGTSDATAANQTLIYTEADLINTKLATQAGALTSVGADQLRVDIISGGGTSDATAANQTTQIAKSTELNDALTSIGTDDVRVTIVGSTLLEAAVGQYDAAGRLDVAISSSVGDYVMSRDGQTPFIATNIDGDGAPTASYDAPTNALKLSVDNLATAAETFSYLQTKQWHPYLAGHAQQPEFTFSNFQVENGHTTKRVGYFSSALTPVHVAQLVDAYDGMFLESTDFDGVSFNVWRDGVQLARIPESSWNTHTAINWTNFNVAQIDFLYLGGTSAKLYMIYDGVKVLMCQYDHANSATNTIMGSPSQPIRAEVTTDDAGVATTASTNVHCANVGTLGDFTTGHFGMPVTLNLGEEITLSTATTKYAVLGIRKNDARPEFFMSGLDVTSAGGVANTFTWELQINPDLTGGGGFDLIWGSGDVSTYLDGGVGDGTQEVYADGQIIASGTGTSRGQVSSEISNALRIGYDIDARAFDQLVLIIIPNAGGQEFIASINGVEL